MAFRTMAERTLSLWTRTFIQGPLSEYDDWRGSLSEEERQQETAAARQRYEAYYEGMVRVVVADLQAQGHDLSAFLRPKGATEL